jgi:hypothetical protein
MNAISETLTSVFGIVLLAAIGYEIRRRRKRLRELYNVLDAEDRLMVADLDQLLLAGEIKPYTPEFEF